MRSGLGVQDQITIMRSGLGVDQRTMMRLGPDVDFRTMIRSGVVVVEVQ